MNHFPSVLALFVITATASHAFNSQVYWHTMLPNSPMPRAILDLISSDELGEENTWTAVKVGKGGVTTNYWKPGGSGMNGNNEAGGVGVNVGKGGVTANYGKPGGSGTNGNNGDGGFGVNVKEKRNNQVGVLGKEARVSVDTGYKGKPAVLNVKSGIHDIDRDKTLFFLEKDLSPGSKFNLLFAKTTSGSPFISRSQANTIPFSSNKMLEIQTRFQIEPSSVAAEAMRMTLEMCEWPAIDGESKLCATSLESMVEFSMLSLGTRDVQAISTTVTGKTGDATVKLSYSVAPAGVRAMSGENLVSCHAQPYPYAVFHCHATGRTKAYKVALEGNDGTKMEAIAVCHLDTANWNPEHLAFQVLKVKPGRVPVCHFLPEGDVVWSVREQVLKGVY